jgi:Protein of unknown function (DUF1553)/Protein of unknown function (DUF1549)/Planctomycete cytochrome C
MAILHISGRKTKFPTRRSGPFVTLALLWLAAGLPLQGQTQRLDFATQVQPILVSRCTVCHGPSTQMSGLRLDSREAALKGGDSGKRAIIPGDAAQSQIILRVSSEETGRRMPPVGEPLTIEEVARLRQWIDQGAEWSAPDVATGPGSQSEAIVLKEHPHWAFQRLRPVEPPPVKDHSWVKTQVDRFILAAQETQGLFPNQMASRPKLIRRLYFDLLGLPPSVDEIEIFVRDTSLNAVEQLIDRLLASPHFGERWGRHWLDAARYADSAGYEEDRPRPGAFHYRDFVIRAFNEDLSYDLFLKWQLAGDLVEPDNPKIVAATGFLTAAPDVRPDFVNFRKKDRYDELDDIVATTGSAVLGLTLGCARCHDHKFDPVPARDYYRMLAFFNSTERFERPLDKAEGEAHARSTAEYEERLKTAKQKLDDWIKAQKAPLRLEKIAALSISEEEKGLLRMPQDESNSKQKNLLDQFMKEIEISDKVLRGKLQENALAEWDALADAVKKIENTKPPDIPRALTLRDGQPKKAYLLERGDPEREKTEVNPGVLTVLTRGEPFYLRNGHSRLALAEWIVDAEHGAGALAARVIVNRLWQHHFGRGLVATPGDFGLRGEPPTHPELLDWLASELIRSGWQLKSLHKLILMSAVYQQSAAYDERRAKLDPANRLWWRREPVRLEAEVLRDSILSVSGTLNRKLYGPAVKPRMDPDAIVFADARYDQWPKEVKEGPATWRRSIYIFTKRSNLFPFLQTFDAPRAIGSCARRDLTTVPTQGLALLNDAFVREQARLFAERVLWESAADPASRVARVYALALGRKPSQSELRKAAGFLKDQAKQYQDDLGSDSTSLSRSSVSALADFCQVLLASNEFSYID